MEISHKERRWPDKVAQSTRQRLLWIQINNPHEHGWWTQTRSRESTTRKGPTRNPSSCSVPPSCLENLARSGSHKPRQSTTLAFPQSAAQPQVHFCPDCPSKDSENAGLTAVLIAGNCLVVCAYNKNSSPDNTRHDHVRAGTRESPAQDTCE